MKKVTKNIADYYSKKIREHGSTPEGVDWNGIESQHIRFEQLLKLTGTGASEIADVGCGYGALLDYLTEKEMNTDYFGYDISPEMIDVARKEHPQKSSNFRTIQNLHEIPDHQYSIASGIFNVKNEVSDNEWLEYVLSSLVEINKVSRSGFAFNLLTSYSDEDKKRDYLYYASPEDLFRFCKENFSRNVALMHDYELYEFTIIVRK